MTMKINPLIFRAYDIRGIYKKDLNEEVFQKIGFVLGKKGESFLVGHDIRKSGRKLALALISGLKKGGAKKIFFCGKTSFGLCFFSGWYLKVNKTLFVTASHLPPEWNGLKINFGDGEPVSSKEILTIRDKVLEIERKKINFGRPTFKKVNLKKEYIQTLIEKFPSLKNCHLKIAIDCGNGSTCLVVPQIFKKLGFKVIEIFTKPDPRFPNRPSEPTFEATQKLRKLVLAKKADFGVAFDGDGDRAVIIDDKGRYLPGNQIGVILGKAMLKEEKRRTVIKTVSCSMTIEEELSKLKAKIIEVPVGHTFVVSVAKKKKAAIGIEESSHIAMPKYFIFDDGVLIPLKVAEILVKERKKLSQLVEEIKIYPFEEFNFECPDEIKFKVIERLSEGLRRKYKKISTLDGIKIYFNFGWVLMRASNTSPKIKVYLEAKTKEKIKFLRKKFLNFLKKCIQQLS